MRALHGTRLVVLFALAIVFAGSLYADSEKPPHGMGKYVIVLWEPGTPVPGHPDERMRRVEKPDVAKAGGRVLSQQVNRMVVYLPFAAAKQLQRHEAVSYIQRIWMGEPFSEWDEDAAATQLRAGNIAANEDPNFTWSKSYSYDADGNITHIGNDSFNYDALQRLTQATVNGSTESYTYDAFGSLTNIASTNGSTAIPTDPGSNRMTGETYDAAGNVTSAKNGARYEFDSMHMMVRYDGAVSGSRRMLYDANDERIGTIVDGTLQRWTIRDFDGQILREFRSNGMSESWIWEQDHIRGEGQLIAGETQRWNYYWEGSNFSYGGHRHYHLDHLGSVRLVTNAAGRTLSENEFYPFGKSQSRQFQEQINGGDPHTDGMRFAGHWRDNLGYPGVEDDNYLDVMHARTYDPNLGRFLSVDPTWDSADLGRPQSWNRYSYVLNNPVRYTDPDGRCTDVLSCGVLGFELGNVPGAVIGIVVGAGVGYGITHPDEVAALGNNMGGGSSGERFAENWIRQNNANHMAEKQEQENKGTAGGDRAGKPFTPKGKQEIHDRNAQQNGGDNRCENCDRKVEPGKKSEKGVTPPGNERQADHIIPRSKGGDGSPSNGQTLCRDCNLDKKDKMPPQ